MSAFTESIFRTMAADATGQQPACTDVDLGVRVPTDVKAASDGTVVPSSKARGMSAFDDPYAMPNHLLPESLGGEPGNRPVWVMHLVHLPSVLDFTITKRAHGVVHPRDWTTISAFRSALCETAADWTVDYA